VLIAAIQEGIASGDYFGYATSVSENGRYEGLRLGTPAPAIYVDAASVLVKPDVAHAQLEAERPGPTVPTGPWLAPDPRPGPTDIPETSPGPSLPTRFFGTAEINPDHAGRDMGHIAEEVLQHLTTLAWAKVKVTVEIEANLPARWCEGGSPAGNQRELPNASLQVIRVREGVNNGKPGCHDKTEELPDYCNRHCSACEATIRRTRYAAALPSVTDGAGFDFKSGRHPSPRRPHRRRGPRRPGGMFRVRRSLG
jgi:hypothetical protein